MVASFRKFSNFIRWICFDCCWEGSSSLLVSYWSCMSSNWILGSVLSL
jgi:hypothetical protein